LRERKGSTGKEFLQWEQRLKRWGREGIGESTLGATKPSKGSLLCFFRMNFFFY